MPSQPLMSSPATARVGAQYPSTAQERARQHALAEYGIAAHDFAQWAESSPEYASLPSSHPARRLVRAHRRNGHALNDETSTVDRILATATPTERALAAEAIKRARIGK